MLINYPSDIDKNDVFNTVYKKNTYIRYIHKQTP